MCMNFTRMKRMTAMIKHIFFLLFSLFFAACQNGSNRTDKAFHEGQMFVKAIPFKTLNGWGYKVFADDKLYIRQAFIPGFPGVYSFANREDAQKVANLVVYKMATTHSLPSVSQTELIQLHILLPNTTFLHAIIQK